VSDVQSTAKKQITGKKLLWVNRKHGAGGGSVRWCGFSVSHDGVVWALNAWTDPAGWLDRSRRTQSRACMLMLCVLHDAHHTARARPAEADEAKRGTGDAHAASWRAPPPLPRVGPAPSLATAAASSNGYMVQRAPGTRASSTGTGVKTLACGTSVKVPPTRNKQGTRREPRSGSFDLMKPGLVSRALALRAGQHGGAAS
jgi:hypothetical protein